MKNKRHIHALPVALVALAAACLPAAAGTPAPVPVAKETPPDSGWHFDLSMPGWLASTSGRVGVGGFVSDIYVGVDQLIPRLDMITAVAAEARHRRLGIYGDLLYVSASDGSDPGGLLSKVDLRLDQYVADLELFYRVIDGPSGFVDVRAGVRYTNIYNEVSLSPDTGALQRAGADVADEVARTVRARLGQLDLVGLAQGRLADRITDALAGLEGGRPALPVAPLAGRSPGRIRESVRRIVARRGPELAAALRAEADAAKAALSSQVQAAREAASKRVAEAKAKIAREIADAAAHELDRSASLTEYWFDPYVGVRAQYNFNRAFYITAKAEVGGFGVGSDITWQGSAALGCQLTRSLYTEIGYRYLYTDYDHNGFVYEVTQQGPEIVAGITF